MPRRSTSIKDLLPVVQRPTIPESKVVLEDDMVKLGVAPKQKPRSAGVSALA
jgi:hypothetical protein